MSKDLIRYDVLVQDSLRAMLRKLLEEVSVTGLPGEHHFFVTFNMKYLGVRASSRLREQYPEEMTIVLQHQFWDLKVSDTAFEIGLSFEGTPERLYLPFASVKSFYDPSVQFGLQFDPELTKSQDEDDEVETARVPVLAEVPDIPRNDDVVRPILPSEREKLREAEAKSIKPHGLAEAKTSEVDEELEADTLNNSDDATDEVKDDDDQKSADVVSLDAFRKKK